MATAIPIKVNTASGVPLKQFETTDTIPATSLPARLAISPSQITSDQDDYSPTGWDTAELVRLDFDTNGRAITGFAAWTNGRTKTLLNVSGNYGYIPAEHPDSTAANRVIATTDIIIPPYSAAVIEYDSTSSRVRIVSNSFNPAALGYGNLKGHYYQVGPGSVTAADWGEFGFNVTGTGATLTTTAGISTAPGGWSQSTGTTATGSVSAYFAKGVTNPAFFGSSHIIAAFVVRIPTASDGTNTFTFSCGIVPTPSSATLDVNSSVVIKYSHGLNSGNFLAVSRDSGGSESTADTGIAPSTTVANLFVVCIDKARSEARYYIDGVMVARITGNMPSAVAVGCRSLIVKSVGTTARTAVLSNMNLITVY